MLQFSSQASKKAGLGQALHSCRVLGFASLLAVSVGSIPDVSAGSPEGNSPEDPLSSPIDLCAWQEDYSFFAAEIEEASNEERIPCDAVFPTPPMPEVAATVSKEKQEFTEELRQMVAGFPIEAMVPAIAEYDRDIAGLIVGIGKKESNWGKRVPLDTNGDDCFNYWGFKGAGARGVAMGHGCFGTPEEAVQAIGNRLTELVALRQTSEPKNMTIWKCGSSCATHSPESVRKWIADVDIYFRQIAKK